MGFLPPQFPSTDSAAILTKTGGADRKNTKHRGQGVQERSRTLANEHPKTDHALDRSRGNRRAGTHEDASPSGRCCSWGHDCRRHGHARVGRAPPRRGAVTQKGGPPTLPGAPTPSTRKTCADTKGPRGDPRARAHALGPVHAPAQSGPRVCKRPGVRTQRGYSHPRTEAQR